MRVGFIGAGGSGKTTVLNELETSGYLKDSGLERVDFVVRPIMEGLGLDKVKMAKLSEKTRWRV